MGRYDKLIRKILLGRSDRNIEFSELRGLLANLGFKERVRGSHHIFTRNDIDEIVNIQPSGSSAKPYQVKQVRELIIRYKIGELKDE